MRSEWANLVRLPEGEGEDDGDGYGDGDGLALYLDAEPEVLIEPGRLHERVAMHAAPSGNVVQCPGVAGEDFKRVAVGECLDAVLGTDDRQRAKQTACVQLVRAHRPMCQLGCRSMGDSGGTRTCSLAPLG